MSLTDQHTARLRHALRGLTLTDRDERYLTHYARTWDDDTVDVIAGWIEQARTLGDVADVERPAPADPDDAPWRWLPFADVADDTRCRARAADGAGIAYRCTLPPDHRPPTDRAGHKWAVETTQHAGPARSAGSDTAETRASEPATVALFYPGTGRVGIGRETMPGWTWSAAADVDHADRVLTERGWQRMSPWSTSHAAPGGMVSAIKRASESAAVCGWCVPGPVTRGRCTCSTPCGHARCYGSERAGARRDLVAAALHDAEHAGCTHELSPGERTYYSTKADELLDALDALDQQGGR